MLVAMPSQQMSAPIVYLERGVLDQGQALEETSTTGGEFLAEIRFDKAHYRCPNRIRLHHQFDGQVWHCWARELSSVCVGEGQTPSLAREDWHQRFHAEFQRLYVKRTFEMTPQESDSWEAILSVVDVVDYRVSTPLRIREIGCVRYRHMPYPYQMRWIDGRRELFTLHQVPAEIAGCKPGQWVEAIVEREPLTGRLIRIVHAQKIPSPLPERPGTLRAAWEGMRKAELPETEWDWHRK